MTKTLRFWDLQEGYACNEIYIEGLNASNRSSMRKYLNNKKEANMHDLAF